MDMWLETTITMFLGSRTPISYGASSFSGVNPWLLIGFISPPVFFILLGHPCLLCAPNPPFPSGRLRPVAWSTSSRRKGTSSQALKLRESFQSLHRRNSLFFLDTGSTSALGTVHPSGTGKGHLIILTLGYPAQEVWLQIWVLASHPQAHSSPFSSLPWLVLARTMVRKYGHHFL